MNRLSLRIALVGLVLIGGGCATPIGIKRAAPEIVERQLIANLITGNELSRYSKQLLARTALTNEFESDPPAVIAAVRAGLGGPDAQDRLMVLGELSFAHAKWSGDRSYYLASVAFLYGFLFPTDTALAPSPYDARVRYALGLYNSALRSGLSTPDGQWIDLRAREVQFPFGSLELVPDTATLRWGGLQLQKFASMDGVVVRGLRNRYRRAGIGAPLAADARAPADTAEARWFPPRPVVPVTVVAVFDEVSASVSSGHAVGHLRLYPQTESQTAQLGAYTVPVEFDTSAVLAYRLEGSPVWDFEIAGFRRGDFRLPGMATESRGLVMLEPYRPGRIPVVFVHGTASSPARWAEMVNELNADPVVGTQYQFWVFQYESGNPIAYSASKLREALTDVVTSLDPTGSDAALHRMVLIGHSQGGLLVKMMAIDSGDRFWRNISDRPFDEVELSADSRALLGKALFFQRLPFVESVIFIATPHRGSFLAGGFVRTLIRKLVRIPSSLARVTMDFVRLNPVAAARSAGSLPTAVDNMDPNAPFIKTLAAIPIAPGVDAHSIIAVQGDGPVEEGNDGVVEYRSAHIDGVASELVVRSSHSTQGEPATIEEVRRILYERLRPEARAATGGR